MAIDRSTISILSLTAAAAVGITMEAPIFVAVVLLFALVAYVGAALEAWHEKSSRRQSLHPGAPSPPPPAP
jgi:hypothetical protein